MEKSDISIDCDEKDIQIEKCKKIESEKRSCMNSSKQLISSYYNILQKLTL